MKDNFRFLISSGLSFFTASCRKTLQFAFFGFIFVLQTSLFPQQDTSLTLNEIMFYPASGNNEFIEIFNLSHTQSFDLTGYKLKYETSNPDSLRPLSRGTVLPPRTYLVVFEGDYDTLTGIYRTLIPADAIIMRIADNSFGTSGMANTADRKIYIINSANDTIDTYTYSANNTQTRSDEKIVLNRDNSPANWGNATLGNGTPGFRNSLSLYQFDLSVSSFSLAPNPVLVNDELHFRFSAKNKGTSPAENFILSIYNDINYDSLPQPGEIIASNNYSLLAPGDSIVFTHTHLVSSPVLLNFIAVISFSQDEFLFNNTAFAKTQPLTAQFEYNSVIINELQYAPQSPEKEWIEIYNRSTQTINLKKWKIADRVTQHNISNTDVLIQPGDFFVITADSSISNLYPLQFNVLYASIPSLNNDGDGVYLKDSLGIIIDSLNYLPSWGGSQGRSLERIYYDSASGVAANWKTSSGLYKGSPGKKNSAAPKDYDVELASFFSPSPYTILPNPIGLVLFLRNKGEMTAFGYTVNVYHDVNSDSAASAAELLLTHNGNILLSGDSTEIRINIPADSAGLYRLIAIISFHNDEDTLNNKKYLNHNVVQQYTMFNDIIINEIMYAPRTGEQEWIEFYNRSSKSYQIKNFGVADKNDTVFINMPAIVPPGTYFVISKDSSVLQNAGYTFPLITASLLTLNNDGDRVLLIDSLHAVLDSVIYPLNSLISGGISLERFSPDISSADTSNWKPAKSKVQATPGRINSITIKDFDIAVTSAVILPRYPVKNDTLSIQLQVNNTGRNTIGGTIFVFADTNNDSIPDLSVAEKTFTPVSSGTTLTILVENIYGPLTSPVNFLVVADVLQDEDTTDNYVWLSAYPDTPPGSVVINEIMYNPANGEPEWIELYNTSSDSILLTGWKVSDVFTTPVKTSIPAGVYIKSDNYLVISKDSSIIEHHRYIPADWIVAPLPVLNNDRDGVILFEERGRTMDSVLYTGGESGISIERISTSAPSSLESNWNFSTDIELSTPGRINSRSPRNLDIAVTEISIYPFAPRPGDSVSFYVTLTNNGTQIPEEFFYEGVIFDSANSYTHTGFVRFPNNNNNLSLIFYKAALLCEKMLTFTIQLHLADDDPYNNYGELSLYPATEQKSIIITEIMYNPLANKPKWIEIYNPTNSPIHLQNWQIGDLFPLPTKQILSGDFTLYQGAYVTIAADSSIITDFNLNSSNVIITPLPSFSVSSDGAAIYDINGYIVDSVIYGSHWSTLKGRSIERVSFTGFSNHPSNWIQSPDPGGTPSRINNAARLLPDTFDKLVINEIMFAANPGKAEYIELYNPSSSPIPLFFYTFGKDAQKQVSTDVQILQPDSFFVVADDSSIFTDYPYLINSGNVYIYPQLTLLNEADSIFVKTFTGAFIDSVFYSKDWHNKNLRTATGISLEKINPQLAGNDSRNWSSSVNPQGGTPGKANSILTSVTGTDKEIEFSPNPFSPDEDGFEDFTIITYNTPFLYGSFIATVFDRFGRRVRKIFDGESLPGKGEFVYDGRDDSGKSLKIGIYILLMEISDRESGAVKTIKAPFVVARRL